MLTSLSPTFEKYKKLSDIEKNAFDEEYLNNFKSFFNDFYSKVDETSKNQFIEDLKDVSGNDSATSIENLNTSIKNGNDIIALATLISENQDYFSVDENENFNEGIFVKEFLDKLNYMSIYFDDKERFLRDRDFEEALKNQLDKLNQAIHGSLTPPTPSNDFNYINFVTNDFINELNSSLEDYELNEAQEEFMTNLESIEVPDNFNYINFVTNDFINELKNALKDYGLNEAQEEFLTNLELITVPEPEEVHDFGIEIDDEGHTNIKKPKDYKFQNEILKRLLSIMPDFSNNLFTFGFFNTDDEELSLSDFALSYFKTVIDLDNEAAQKFNHINNNIDGFYTRVQGFDIPLPKAHTIQYKFFTRTITKVTSGIEQAHTINVKFIADQNGFIINHFQRMNNQHNPIPEKSTERELSLKELQGMFSSGGYTNRDKTLNIFIKYNDIRDSDQTSHRLYAEDSENYKMFDISNSELKEFHNKLGFNGYFLEDVQFLGFENPIEFQRDTADPIEMEAKFRFKRLYKVQ